MTAYTAANYHVSVLPGGLGSPAKGAISYAIHLGWELTVRKQVCHLTCPMGDQHITIGVRSKNEDWNAIKRKIEKHGSPLVPNAARIETEDQVRRFANVAVDQQRQAKAAADAAAAQKLAEQQERKERATKNKVTLVKEGPMISKGGTLGGYTSNIANQREWSDETIDYACVRCGYVTTTPRGAAAHWGKHVREDERNRGGHKGVEVPMERSAYQPTEERLSSLADALADALKEGIDWTDPEEAARQLALAALTWDHDRRNDSEPGMREPLSDTDILNKIRSLVDNGLYESQEFAIVDLQAKADQAEVRAAAAEAQVEAMRANLTAFMGMMVEEFEVTA